MQRKSLFPINGAVLLVNIGGCSRFGGGVGGTGDPSPWGGALECSLKRRCPFFKNLHAPFRKKFAFRYPVSELLDYKNSKNNRKTIVYCP